MVEPGRRKRNRLNHKSLRHAGHASRISPRETVALRRDRLVNFLILAAMALFLFRVPLKGGFLPLLGTIFFAVAPFRFRRTVAVS